MTAPDDRWLVKVTAAGVCVVVLGVIGGLLILPKSGVPGPDAVVSGSHPDADLLTDEEKKYFGAAAGYLKTVVDQDKRLATVMVQSSTGEATLGDVHDTIKGVRFVEDAGFSGDYSAAPVPVAFQKSDIKIQECRKLHESVFRELLEYWDDQDLSHLESGMATFRRSVYSTKDSMDRLSADTESLKKQRAAPAVRANAQAVNLPLAESGKVGPKEIEQMVEGALWLDRFADAVKLMNVIREDYPKSHEARTLRDVRRLLHPERSNVGPYTESDARGLRSILDSLRTIKAKYPSLPAEQRRAVEAIFGRAFFESNAANADSALKSLQSMIRAKDAALKGE